MDVGKVIAEAEAELAKIERQLAAMRPLIDRKKVLEGMLFHARKLLSTNTPRSTKTRKGKVIPVGRTKAQAEKAPDQPERTHTVAPEEAKLWEGIRSVISQVGYPMKASDVVSALTARGWKLSQHGKEVVRGAINRRPDIFVRTPEGYTLVELKAGRNGAKEATA